MLLTSTSDVSDHRQQQDYGNVLPFKVVYNHQLRKLHLRRRINNLIKKLRWDLGDTFLQNTRIVLAHPVQSNVFMKTYRHGTSCATTQRQQRERHPLEGLGEGGRALCVSDTCEPTLCTESINN